MKLLWAISRVFYMAMVNVTPIENTKHAIKSTMSMKFMWWVMPLGEHTNARLLKWAKPYCTKVSKIGPKTK